MANVTDITRPIDEVSGYLIAESPEHHALHKQGAYSLTHLRENIAANGVVYLEFITPATGESSYQNPVISTEGYIKAELIEGVAATDGTIEVPLVNRMRTSTKEAQTVFYSDPTNISGGTVLRTSVWGNISGLGQSTHPLGGGCDTSSINFKPNTKYVIKFTNMENVVIKSLFFSCTFYEF